jgi:hypothetical protein
MKKTVIILTIIFLSISAKAECHYYSSHIKFTFEAIDGKISNGYICQSSCHFFDKDLLEIAEYLKKQDSLYYFQDRIKYEYQNSFGKDTIYYPTNEKSVSSKNIKTIKIDEMFEKRFVNISELQLSDTSWLKQEPVKNISFGGIFCGHTLLVHTNSEKIDNVIRQLEVKQKEANEKTKLYNENPNEINLNIMYDVEEELEKIIDKFKGEKVVIISYCSD